MSRTHTVALSGATGFVGRHIASLLVERGHRVRAMVRDRAKARAVLPDSDLVTLHEGDVFDGRSAPEACTGATACVNTIGIIREVPGGLSFERAHVGGTRVLIEACRGASVRRFVQISALGVRADGCCEYQRTKWEAEELLRRSGLEWTILRPGLVHGLGSEFVELAAGWVSGHAPPYFFIPYFSRVRIDHGVPGGRAIREEPVVQPIDVKDVAAAVVASLDRDESIGEVYNLVGPETLTWPRALRLLRDHLPGGNKTLHPVGISGRFAAGAWTVLSKLGLGHVLPFDRGVALMATEDATASGAKAREDLGLEPEAFSTALPKYASRV